MLLFIIWKCKKKKNLTNVVKSAFLIFHFIIHMINSRIILTVSLNILHSWDTWPHGPPTRVGRYTGRWVRQMFQFFLFFFFVLSVKLHQCNSTCSQVIAGPTSSKSTYLSYVKHTQECFLIIYLNEDSLFSNAYDYRNGFSMLQISLSQNSRKLIYLIKSPQLQVDWSVNSPRAYETLYSSWWIIFG